ncbi:eukaryotic type KH-domain (KH-domain type I) [Auricularia subglabra TFB-10046 SS5]|nr:eukaryotic type KH-domain (KH-domain type I) [Auricularia subglabra TFB-10046 SS5]
MSSTKRKWDQHGPEDDSASPPAKAPKTDDAQTAGASGGKNAADAAAAAAAIAAKIAAQFSASGALPPKEVHDAEFTHDIDINDVRNRYLLTKGQTQADINTETGASVTTKGVWYPDRSRATERDPPLYLHIAAHSQESLQKAIDKVNELLALDLGSLVEERKRETRRKWPEEKITIGLDMLRNFNVRAKVVGPGGMFVKYIQQETGTRVQIKGQGSGFYDSETGKESDEPMHIHITGPDDGQVARAKVLTDDLLEVVRGEHAKARAMNSQAQMEMQQAQMYAAYGAYGYQPPPPSGDAPPPPPDAQGGAPQPGAQQMTLDQFIQYYAAYGYDTTQQQFRDWAAQQYQQYYGAGGTGMPAGGAPAPPSDQPPPPPPPADGAPPPPPPS